MEWLQKILQGISEGKNAEEIQKEIQTELPKHFKPSKEFNDLNEKLKTAEGENKSLKETQQNIQTEYENYKKGSISQADYEVKVQEIKAESNKTIKEANFNNKLDMYLMGDEVKSRNIKSVRANLDVSKVTLEGDNFIGLKEQLEKLQKSDPYLFNVQEKRNKGAGYDTYKREDNDDYEQDDNENLSDAEYFAKMEKNK